MDLVYGLRDEFLPMRKNKRSPRLICCRKVRKLDSLATACRKDQKLFLILGKPALNSLVRGDLIPA